MSIIGGQQKKHAFNPKQQKPWNALYLSLIITSLFTVVFHWSIYHSFVLIILFKRLSHLENKSCTISINVCSADRRRSSE